MLPAGFGRVIEGGVSHLDIQLVALVILFSIN